MTTAWSEAPLGDLLLRLFDHRGRTPKKLGGDFVESGVRVISAKNIRDGRLDLEANERFITREMFDRWMPEKLGPGDVLLTSEAPMGSVAFLNADHDYCLGQRLFALRADPGVLDARFLYYMLQSSLVQARLRARLSGTTAEGIRQAELVRVLLPHPSLREQRRISHVLGTLDDLIGNNRRRIVLLEQMAQATYREWFAHFRYPSHEDNELVESPLGPIPAGWSTARLGDVIELRYGKALKASDRKGGPVAVVGSSGIVGWHDESIVSGPSVVVGRKGNVGSVIWIEGESWPIDTTYYVTTDLPLHYVYRTLCEIEFIDSHAAVPGLSRDQAYSIDVLRPSLELAALFEDTASELSAMSAVLASQAAVLSRIRDALLPKLVTGAIDVSHLGLDSLVEESAA